MGRVQGSGPNGRILKEDLEAFKSGLVSSIADRLVDRIAEKSGATTTAEMYAAAAEAMPESAAAAASGVPAAPAAQQAAATSSDASAAAEGTAEPTRIPIRGYRRWVDGKAACLQLTWRDVSAGAAVDMSDGSRRLCPDES